jgi:2,4-didehydro-3-deoxy-L-rhamnonate hydrolase
VRQPVFSLGTFAIGAREFPGLVVDDGVVEVPAPSVRDLLDDWDAALPRLRDLLDGHRTPLAELTVRAPVAPRQILQAGANYRTHVLDLAVKHAPAGADLAQVRATAAAMMDQRAARGEPFLFTGLPSAVTGPYDDVVLPEQGTQHDWELELAAVIGRRTHQVSPATALEHVAGYTIVNDLTTRDLVFRTDMPELGADWFRAKNAPGFLPTGPLLVPAEFVDPGELRITLKLGEDTMQDESTKDMIFDVAALVAAASRTCVLWPGDLVLTGSPAGNGLHHGRLLRPGDVMTGTITGLGTQRTRVVAP